MMDPFAGEIESLVRRGHESPDVDAKAPGSWRSWNSGEKAELVRDMMALANSDRPGWILLGISEGSTGQWIYEGLSAAQSASFDPSDIGGKVKRLSDPEVRFSIHRVEVDSRLYVAIRVEPFQAMPHTCKSSSGSVIDEGAVYVRTAACQTAKVTTAEQMRLLIERAVQMHADAIVAQIAALMTQAGLVGTRDVSAESAEAWSEQIREARRRVGS